MKKSTLGPSAQSYADAYALRRAAMILRERSRRPRSLWLRAICNVLNDTASAIAAENDRRLGGRPGT